MISFLSNNYKYGVIYEKSRSYNIIGLITQKKYFLKNF